MPTEGKMHSQLFADADETNPIQDRAPAAVGHDRQKKVEQKQFRADAEEL